MPVAQASKAMQLVQSSDLAIASLFIRLPRIIMLICCVCVQLPTSRFPTAGFATPRLPATKV